MGVEFGQGGGEEGEAFLSYGVIPDEIKVIKAFFPVFEFVEIIEAQVVVEPEVSGVVADSLFQDIHGAGDVVLDDGEINTPDFIVLVEERIEFGDGAEAQVHPAVAVIFFVMFGVSLQEGQYPKIAGEQALVAHGKKGEKILI